MNLVALISVEMILIITLISFQIFLFTILCPQHLEIRKSKYMHAHIVDTKY